MNSNMRNLLLDNISKAYKGRELWIKLIEENSISDKTYVILMPSLNRKYNYYALLHLNQFLEQKNADQVVILTFDEEVIESAEIFSEKVKKVINFSRESSELLMKFYSLYMFTDKLIIVSLEEPEGRSGMQLIGKKGITLEEVIAIGIYGLRKFESVEPPQYNGNNNKIRSFLENQKEEK